MRAPPEGGRATPADFDAFYLRAADPWRYADDPYELAKYRTQLDWLTGGGVRRFARGLDVGCSTGVFTRMLASVCDRVDAMDVSAVVASRAADDLGDLAHVHVASGTFPSDAPAPGRHDAVVVGEVLYYLDDDGLGAAAAWLRAAAFDGGRAVVATFAFAERAPAVLEMLDGELGDVCRRSVRWPQEGADDTGRAYHLHLLGI